jgi:hypothetical protein
MKIKQNHAPNSLYLFHVQFNVAQNIKWPFIVFVYICLYIYVLCMYVSWYDIHEHVY